MKNVVVVGNKGDNSDYIIDDSGKSVDINSIMWLRVTSNLSHLIRNYTYNFENSFTINDLDELHDVCRNSTPNEFADYFLDMMGYPRIKQCEYCGCEETCDIELSFSGKMHFGSDIYFCDDCGEEGEDD